MTKWVIASMKPKTKRGYVYAFHSNAFPGLIKIGHARNVAARLSSANTFAAPNPFKIICVTPSLDPKRDESITHHHFASFRRAGEFFEISHDDIKNFFATVLVPAFDKEKLEKDKERLEQEEEEKKKFSAPLGEYDSELNKEDPAYIEARARYNAQKWLKWLNNMATSSKGQQ